MKHFTTQAEQDYFENLKKLVNAAKELSPFITDKELDNISAVRELAKSIAKKYSIEHEPLKDDLGNHMTTDKWEKENG